MQTKTKVKRKTKVMGPHGSLHRYQNNHSVEIIESDSIIKNRNMIWSSPHVIVEVQKEAHDT